MPTREVIAVNVGGAGVRMGAALVEQLMAEHQIELDGTPSEGFDHDNTAVRTFFEETGAGQFLPRGVSVDLEPSAVDQLRSGPMAQVFHPEFLLNGKEDAANNFARGHYTVGKEIIDQVNDRLRKLAENCDGLQGFMMHHSLGGGTGSGLGTLILERLAVDYRKKAKIGIEVLAGDPAGRQTPCQSYNQLLATHWLLDHTEVSLLFDNSQLGAMCQRLNVKPTYEHVNSLIARVVSGVTSQMRFDGELPMDLLQLEQDLVPFPRLHFCTCSVPGFKTSEGKTLRESSDDALQPQNMTLNFRDFDVVEDKYMGMLMMYRGEVSEKEAKATIAWLTQNGKMSFVDWLPNKVKVGGVSKPQPKAEGICLETEERTASIVGNNVAVSRVFSRNNKKYDKLYSQRAYVHHYVGEGMEEGELSEAREDLGFLEKDYLDVLTEQASDEDDDDEDFR